MTTEVQCPLVEKGRCSTVTGLQRTTTGTLTDGVYAHLVIVHQMEQDPALALAVETVHGGD